MNFNFLLFGELQRKVWFYFHIPIAYEVTYPVEIKLIHNEAKISDTFESLLVGCTPKTFL